jgi:hypothetical protein
MDCKCSEKAMMVGVDGVPERRQPHRPVFDEGKCPRGGDQPRRMVGQGADLGAGAN